MILTFLRLRNKYQDNLDQDRRQLAMIQAVEQSALNHQFKDRNQCKSRDMVVSIVIRKLNPFLTQKAHPRSHLLIHLVYVYEWSTYFNTGIQS